MNLNKEQSDALNTMLSGRNCFLTGKAGTGKSTVVNEFIEQTRGKNVLVFAPTGVAAIRVGGSTIHRGFKLPISIIEDPQELRVPETIMMAKTVIIDEISMVRVDVFDSVMAIIDKANKIRQKYHMSDIQVILVGDFYQLPPVITDKQIGALEALYPNMSEYFAFNSENWKKLNLSNIVLKTVVRQDNSDFARMLNGVRQGDSSSLTELNSKACKQKIKDAVILVGLNKQVKFINEEELEKIDSPLVQIPTMITGEVSKSDMNVDEVLAIKKGARVMTLVNSDEYQNGTMGHILDILDKEIVVELDNGFITRIKKHRWEVIEYGVIYDGDGNKRIHKWVIGEYSQYPIKLAYAISIHKSQGQTFEKMNLNPYSWDHGQLYVALSRATSLDSLHLLYPIKPDYLKTSYSVINFYKSLEI